MGIDFMKADGSTQLCTFQVAGVLLGIEVSLVREIRPLDDITPIPRAPPEIRGAANLRGEIILVIDLRVRIGFAKTDREEDRGAEGRFLTVVLRSAEEPTALLCEELGDIVEVMPEQARDTPSTLPEGLGQIVSAVYALPGQLVFELDVAKVIDLEC